MVDFSSAVRISRSSEIPDLGQNEIHLWFCKDVLRLCNVSYQNLKRSAFIQVRQKTHHFILNHLLDIYLGCPTQKKILRTSHGKPYVTDPMGLHFNLSHTRESLLVAFARYFSVGVDLEISCQPRRCQELSARFFSKDEDALILSSSTEKQKDIFLQLWTAKEAMLKAYGTGISAGLNQINFALTANETLQLCCVDEKFGSLQEWHFIPLRPTSDHVGALAWRGEKCKITIFELSETS